MPWKAALLSPAFLAILVAHTCSNWGWYMVLIELPMYMSTVLNFPISQNAVLTAIPFLCMWIFSIILSKILDTLRAKGIITTTIARKVATGFASIVPMVCFIILCFIGCQKTLAVVLMTLAIMCIGGKLNKILHKLLTLFGFLVSKKEIGMSQMSFGYYCAYQYFLSLL